mgnify:CR=1 FL=1
MTYAELQRELGQAALATAHEPARIKNAVGARCVWSIITLPGDPSRYKKIAASACIRMQTFY